jgi:hypothetical protein
MVRVFTVFHLNRLKHVQLGYVLADLSPSSIHTYKISKLKAEVTLLPLSADGMMQGAMTSARQHHW